MITRRYDRIPKPPTGLELLYMALGSLAAGLLIFLILGPFIAAPAGQIVSALIAATLVFLVRYSPRIIRRVHYAIIRTQHHRYNRSTGQER